MEPEPLLTPTATAQLLRVHPKTLQIWRREGKAPPHVMVNSRVRYRLADVEAWLVAQQGGEA